MCALIFWIWRFSSCPGPWLQPVEQSPSSSASPCAETVRSVPSGTSSPEAAVSGALICKIFPSGLNASHNHMELPSDWMVETRSHDLQVVLILLPGEGRIIINKLGHDHVSKYFR